MFPHPSYENFTEMQIPPKAISSDYPSQANKTSSVSEFGKKKWLDHLLKLSPRPEPSILSELRYDSLSPTQSELGSDTSTQALHFYHPLPTLQQDPAMLSSTAWSYPSVYIRGSAYYAQCDSQHSIQNLPHPIQEPWSLPKLERLDQKAQSSSKLGCLEPSYTPCELPMLPTHSDHQLPLALRKPLTNSLKNQLPKEAHHSKKCFDKGKSPVLEKAHQAGIEKRCYTKKSYDPKKNFLLNGLFFDTIGNGRKPTRAERRSIQKKIGISPRRLTYWLSNHKRRFKPELTAYKRLSLEGRIHSYNSFLQYCRQHIVPEVKGRYLVTDLAGEALSSDEKSAFCNND